MVGLLLVGLDLIICLALFVIVSIVGLFVGHIILFDSIALAIAAGFVAHGVFHIHPAVAIIIGISVLAGLYFLQNTKVGFWIIGGLLSLAWGFIFCSIAYMFSNHDAIWTYVVFGAGTLLMIWLHIKARSRIAA